MKKFITDGMLKGLMRWLRFLGFDTIEFTNPLKQNVKEAEYAERHFLTASPGHFQKWKGDKKILIPFERISDQLNYLNKELKIFEHIEFLSRCSMCNEVIIPVKKDEVIDKIPENVAKNFNQFYQCPDCKRIYWQGGHVKRIINKLSRIGVTIFPDK